MRLIDADELLEIIRRDWSLFQGATECKHSQYDELFHMRWCNGEEVKDDDFCSYGERKDDER